MTAETMGHRFHRLKLPLILAFTLLSACTAFQPAPTSPVIQRDAHGRIQRSEAVRNAFKREHPCPATQQPKGPCPGYVIDHVIALKRGGADTPANMQWQTVDEAKAKDRVE
jgi:hypothetical protein